MDEGRIPRELTTRIFYVEIIFIAMAIFFAYSINSGMYIILGLLGFMLIFSNMNKSLMKKEIKKSVHYTDDWYKSKYKLSKEIP